MRALITGLSGFVGPYLGQLLQKRGQEVFGFDRHISTDSRVRQIDILNQSAVAAAIKEICPDFVYHLAGFSSVHESWKNPEMAKKVNVVGTRHLLDAVAHASMSTKVLIVSSAEVYGPPTKIPIDETHPVNPKNPYAESRVSQEELCRQYDVSIVIARSFNHTGPGQKPIFAIPSFAHQIAEIERDQQTPVIRVGNIEAKRDFTDVRDVVNAYWHLLDRGRAGEVYNVCSGRAYSLKEILQTMLSLTEQKITYEIDPEKLRQHDTPIIQGSNEKIARTTSWQPQITMTKTLKDILDYWRQRMN